MKIDRFSVLAASTLMMLVVGICAEAPAAAAGSTSKASKCAYYDPRPRCTEKEREARRKIFGLPSLEKIQRRTMSGGEASELIVATVMVKQREGLALVLQRDRGGTPIVEIHSMPVSSRPADYQPIRAIIPEAIWALALAKGNALDLVYDTDEVLVCGANFSVEIVDKEGNVRAPDGDSCGGEPRGVYFDFLAEAALQQLPHCAALMPSISDWVLEKLAACFDLRGDKKIAAELYNRLQSLEDRSFWETNDGWTDPSEILPLLDEEISFSWLGIPLMDDAEMVANFWTGGWLAPVKFKTGPIFAGADGSARVEGRVVFETSTSEGVERQASGTFTSTWRRGADGKFRMRRFDYLAPSVRAARLFRSANWRKR
ncbi:hypothetical protein DXH95_11320 [Sphingorhabdus pulchriflava]|uniref:DUF4440 domain-containing protein n=1 Tax=Sphingorhabdus pulchriflava TaxID=2292257 RepID=A0A371B4R3_9SPHN|nr:hypothetical protein [Sphingorhabdus pulchriflava]RDV02550.1 hypothetical protein DXH95_11320 [Sphingorhabdus pulchriflava]